MAAASLLNKNPAAASWLRRLDRKAAQTSTGEANDWPDSCYSVHAVWLKVSHLRPKVRYVVDELVKLCAHWQ